MQLTVTLPWPSSLKVLFFCVSDIITIDHPALEKTAIRKQSRRALWSFIYSICVCFVCEEAHTNIPALRDGSLSHKPEMLFRSAQPGVKLQKSKKKTDLSSSQNRRLSAPLSLNCNYNDKTCYLAIIGVKCLEISGLKCLLQKFPRLWFGIASFRSLLALMDPLSIVFSLY